jgi:hypothetical protein
LVTADQPWLRFEIQTNRVTWLRAKSDTPVVVGGVSNFDAGRGADVDVTIRDTFDGQTHRLSGTVGCKP